MTLVVLRHTHSSGGNCKYVKQVFREFSRHLTAEGKSFSLAVLNASKNFIAFDLEAA
jgi:hypothetical protein